MRPGQWSASENGDRNQPQMAGAAPGSASDGRNGVGPEFGQPPRPRSTVPANGPGSGQRFLTLKLPTGPVPAPAFWFCCCCWDQARNSAPGAASDDSYSVKTQRQVQRQTAGTASAPDPANRHGPGQPIRPTAQPRPTVPAAETATGPVPAPAFWSCCCCHLCQARLSRKGDEKETVIVSLRHGRPGQWTASENRTRNQPQMTGSAPGSASDGRVRGACGPRKEDCPFLVRSRSFLIEA
jgi:hypothetical protein